MTLPYIETLHTGAFNHNFNLTETEEPSWLEHDLHIRAAFWAWR